MIELIREKRDALIKLCQGHHVKSLEVFGSAVTDEFDEASSDIDLLVEFDQAVGTNRFNNYFDLLRALERLFCRKVDLVEPGGITNPYFINQLNRTRRRLYAAS